MSSIDITTVFTKGVPLSYRTIQNRTKLSKRNVIFQVEQTVNNGTLRRIDPSEVGSNKYFSNNNQDPIKGQDSTRAFSGPGRKKKYGANATIVNSRIGHRPDLIKGKHRLSTEGLRETALKRRYFHKKRMNVFVLV